MTRLSVRAVALCALATLTMALVGAAPIGATPRAGATRPNVAMLSASPDSNLVSGQAITVTASGYPTHAQLDLVQCVQDQGCDFSNLQLLDSGDSGGYTTTVLVRRLLTLDGGVRVDCAAAQNCILVSLDISDLSTGAQTSITFDPNVPPPPPLRFRIAPDPTGSVRVDKGTARITGTVHCNQPVDISMDIELVQVWHQQVFTSDSFTDVLCTHDGRFALTFRPVNGLFGEGAAQVRIDGFGNASTSYELIKNVTVTLVQST